MLGLVCFTGSHYIAPGNSEFLEFKDVPCHIPEVMGLKVRPQCPAMLVFLIRQRIKRMFILFVYVCIYYIFISIYNI